MKKEEGFSTASLLFIIFSLCVSILAVASIVSSRNIKINSLKNLGDEKEKAEDILNGLVDDFQSLRNEKYDNERCNEIINIVTDYSEYNLEVKDVSTGINKQFLNEQILKDKNIQELFDFYEEDIESEFGWINIKYIDEKNLKKVFDDFESSDSVKLFPLINSLPFYNIYYMNEDFILAILKLNKIKDPDDKALLLYEKCLSEDIDADSIAKELGVSSTNTVMDFIGTKTNFWRIYFETEKYKVTAVIAGVPYKKDRIKEIEKYILIEKEIKYKGELENAT